MKYDIQSECYEKNDFPEFLRIQLLPSFCPRKCKNKGAKFKISVQFQINRLNLDGHWIQMGLRNGQLILELNGIKAINIFPMTVIKETLEIKKTGENSSQANLGFAKSNIVWKTSEKMERVVNVSQVISHFDEKNPSWFFQANDNKNILNGIIQNLSIETKKFDADIDKNCSCKYQFVVNESSWKSEIGISPGLTFMKQIFSKLKIIAFVKEIMKIYQQSCFISEGECVCPKK